MISSAADWPDPSEPTKHWFHFVVGRIPTTQGGRSIQPLYLTISATPGEGLKDSPPRTSKGPWRETRRPWRVQFSNRDLWRMLIPVPMTRIVGFLVACDVESSLNLGRDGSLLRVLRR